MDQAKPVVIGSDYQASPTEAFNGHIDEVRISKASARFTAGFTPTTSEYGSDNNTVLLLHANGTDASTTFTDASGGTSDIRSNGGDSATSVITADYSQHLVLNYVLWHLHVYMDRRVYKQMVLV